mmetsp:Transcript_21295/g.60795  ORF Transcript_21295/g.60795 Transcript_21295/m.60795 type:complete len:252 (-) Transcript_21295:879-1634(-)
MVVFSSRLCRSYRSFVACLLTSMSSSTRKSPNITLVCKVVAVMASRKSTNIIVENPSIRKLLSEALYPNASNDNGFSGSSSKLPSSPKIPLSCRTRTTMLGSDITYLRTSFSPKNAHAPTDSSRFVQSTKRAEGAGKVDDDDEFCGSGYPPSDGSGGNSITFAAPSGSCGDIPFKNMLLPSALSLSTPRTTSWPRIRTIPKTVSADDVEIPVGYSRRMPDSDEEFAGVLVSAFSLMEHSWLEFSKSCPMLA